MERAFRSMKSVDLKVRPINHYLADRVRAHILICMLAYYVEWHMKEALAPMLFIDDDPEAAEAARKSVVSPAGRSRKAKDKDASKRTEDGLPVHSFQTLLKDLRTLTMNEVTMGSHDLKLPARPTPVQQRAFQLLEVKETL